jgi:molybdopterin-guanine dinucleotide biosynthesis protein A
MTSKDHNKHAYLAKPALGTFGRNEWAVVGTNCGAIKELADALIRELSPTWQCAYADASHDDEGAASLPGRLMAGASYEYISEPQFHRFNINSNLNHFGFRQMFSGADLIFVNGNHHQARAQVVVIDPAKKASLQKRLARLTDVHLILLTDPSVEVFDFIKEQIPSWQQIPVYNLADTEKIAGFFQQYMEQAKPPVKGLVLAGGKSERMGHDKGSIRWHGKEQRFYMADLLGQFCKDVFISCRAEQENDFETTYRAITDTFTGLGPFGAILSAFRTDPGAAWLVTACDLPFVDKGVLQKLIENRSSKAIATTYRSVADGHPEPLITIWEPKSYPVLLSFLSQGYTCPRKVLLNSEIKLLNPERPEVLMNVNTPDEFEQAKRLMQH